MHPDLKRALAELLVAPYTLSVDAADEPGISGSGVDLLHVQGRGDRLHGIVIWREDSASSMAVTAPVNWLWLVAETSSAASRSVQEVATTLGAGVLAWNGTVLTRVAPAPPRPGIFISRWPSLRARWRTISDW